MNQTARILGSLFFATLTGCGASGVAQNIAPFSERPNETYTFQYTTLNVSGVVWSFEENGRYVSFGGALGLIYEGSNEFAVSVSDIGIDLSNASDVTSTNQDDLADLIKAAETYCSAAGYVRQGQGAGIYTNNGDLYLIGFCSNEP